uniref:Uncharacterized protein n=2 Tax=Phaseolus vulgaris TaxID=3885 RepID=V7APK1_PHAVU|nr:hypothetical protein PHAVU_010G055800g [Phaseolus vulgaris]ESW06533.1 hypothetical protein PHAVU_010G055800g [Phaseolus vulgaris]
MVRLRNPEKQRMHEPRAVKEILSVLNVASPTNYILIVVASFERCCFIRAFDCQMFISNAELARRLKEDKPTIGVVEVGPNKGGASSIGDNSDEGKQIASYSHLKRKRTSNDATRSVSHQFKIKRKAEGNLNPEGSCLGKKLSMWDQEFNFSTHNRSHNVLEGDVPKFGSWGVDQLCGGAEKYLSRAVALMCLANLKAKENANVANLKAMENANAESKREKQLHDLQQEVDNLQADVSKREKQLRDLQKEVVQLLADAVEVYRLRSEATKLSNEKSILYLKLHNMGTEKKLKDEELYELRKKKAEFTKSIQDFNVKEAEWKETEESLKNQITLSFESGFVAALEQVAVLHLTIDLSELDLCKVVVDGKLVKEEEA